MELCAKKFTCILDEGPYPGSCLLALHMTSELVSSVHNVSLLLLMLV
jgi:hypothetical protein